jgi:tRNA (cytidine/uridine-2'-O-)-methyltransferase
MGVAATRGHPHFLFMLHVVLIEPEIPPNTGNIGRLCLAAGAALHLVGPLGFSIDDRTLKRAGLDYWKEVDCRRWADFAALQASAGPAARFFFLTTKTDRAYWNETFRDGDYLVFGRESKGLPEALLAAHPDQCLTIPQQGVRSLNLATATGIVLFEAVRQLEQR